MDLMVLADASRFVVVGAMLTYLISWIILCAEAGLRSRAERSVATSTLASVGADAGSGGVELADAPESARLPADVAERARRLGAVARAVLLLAVVALAAGVAMRALGAGRAPWANMYEFSITGALVASVVLLVLTRTVAGRSLVVWGVLVILLTLGLAVTVLYVAPGPLVPALRSYWLVIHVGCAVFAFGLFTIAAVVSALQLVAERSEAKGAARGTAGSLPAAATLDRLAYRLIAVGFPIWTIGPLILGAIWAEVSWGRYWGWDPKEVWALITWLVYAAYLHARATAGWKGSKASVVALVGYGTAIFSYFGVNIFINGLHSYGGV